MDKIKYIDIRKDKELIAFADAIFEDIENQNIKGATTFHELLSIAERISILDDLLFNKIAKKYNIDVDKIIKYDGKIKKISYK